MLLRTFGPATAGLRADVGKGRACPTRLLDGELLLLVRAYALSNVVGQTPSYCFAVPPPSSGPLVLSLLFAQSLSRHSTHGSRNRRQISFSVPPEVTFVVQEGCFVAPVLPEGCFVVQLVGTDQVS